MPKPGSLSQNIFSTPINEKKEAGNPADDIQDRRFNIHALI